MVVAVNPNKIEMCESLRLFKRLQSRVVERYDFANGAPAVGASLDLSQAAAQFQQLSSYAAVLPAPGALAASRIGLREHQRFSIRCPARLRVASYGARLTYPLTVIELSLNGFRAECSAPQPEGTFGRVAAVPLSINRFTGWRKRPDRALAKARESPPGIGVLAGLSPEPGG